MNKSTDRAALLAENAALRHNLKELEAKYEELTRRNRSLHEQRSHQNESITALNSALRDATLALDRAAMPRTIRCVLSQGAYLPMRANEDDSGLDLRASQSATIPPGTREWVNTGVTLEIPSGFEGQVRPRSGNSGRSVDVALGTIDASFRGEVKALVINNTDKDYTVQVGDKVAQLVIAPIALPNLVWVTEELSTTKRGANGYGSTGR